MTVRFLTGDCRDELRKLKAKSVQMCMTSPPYWGLRDYKIPPSIWGGDPKCRHRFSCEVVSGELRKGAGLGERMKGGGHKQGKVPRIKVETGFCIRCGAWRGCLGLEPTYQLYIEHIVMVFEEVWRVLRDDGLLFVNMGDCYAAERAGWSAAKYAAAGTDDRAHRDKPFNTFTPKGRKKPGGIEATNNGERTVDWGYRSRALQGSDAIGRRTPGKANGTESNTNGAYYGPDIQPNRLPQPGLKQKDLAGMPWRVAFALQDAGWYLRRDIIWHKLNPMPESTYDRCTTSHEYVFMLSKSGDTLLWRHQETGQWVYKKPEPEWRWRLRDTREIVSVEPKDAQATDRQGNKVWIKFNLWRGFDYYYDFAAVMEPSSPDSHARAARSRAKDHKHTNGSDISGKPHGIAIGSPVAGRLPTPAGWAEGTEGHHGSVHPNGRRQLPPEWKQGGPNSRFHSDKVPVSRKVGIGHNARPTKAVRNGEFAGPRPANNESYDQALRSPTIVPMRNKRSVWSIATAPFKEAHFATFPPKLVEPCILAGCPKGGLVLDPFGGAGTVGLVADQLGRNAILIERSKKYVKMAETRIARARMGPEEKKRHSIKSGGKLKSTTGLPLFAKRKAVTRDRAQENV